MRSAWTKQSKFKTKLQRIVIAGGRQKRQRRTRCCCVGLSCFFFSLWLKVFGYFYKRVIGSFFYMTMPEFPSVLVELRNILKTALVSNDFLTGSNWPKAVWSFLYIFVSAFEQMLIFPSLISFMIFFFDRGHSTIWYSLC